jgi:uncharacterized hydrophobic protein (TIGR00271 family)
MSGESKLLFLIHIPSEDDGKENDSTSTASCDTHEQELPENVPEKEEKEKNSPKLDKSLDKPPVNPTSEKLEKSPSASEKLEKSPSASVKLEKSPSEKRNELPSEKPGKDRSPKSAHSGTPNVIETPPTLLGTPKTDLTRKSSEVIFTSSTESHQFFTPPTKEELDPLVPIEDETDVAPQRGSKLNDQPSLADKKSDENDNEGKPLESIDKSAEIEKVAEISSPDPEDQKSFILREPSKEALKRALSNLKIKDAQWSKTEQNFYQVTFIEEGGQRCEEVLQEILETKLGVDPRSSISVMPVNMHFQVKSASKSNSQAGLADSKASGLNQTSRTSKTLTHFVKSVKSRLIVMQVVEGVQANARLTFDFAMLVILASLLAACGLIEDSSVILVASMLVSPLMGPILAGVFGWAISNSELRNLGIKTELIGLFVCVAVGFLLGIFFSVFKLENQFESWPTDEMRSRGLLRSLWMGVLIALPSGAAVALSVLGGNVGSLVGVAISASLLPPMVNGGILLGTAVSQLNHCSVTSSCNPEVSVPAPTNASLINGTSVPASLINGTFSPISVPVTIDPHSTTYLRGKCSQWGRNQYKQYFSCSLPEEAALLGITSITLTILNIACIFLMGIIVLKIKEVAPRTALSAAAKSFWKKDIPSYRDYYKTLKPGGDAIQDMMKEWKATRGGQSVDDFDEGVPADGAGLRDLVSQIGTHPHVQEIFNRAPKQARCQTVFEDFGLQALFSPGSDTDEDYNTDSADSSDSDADVFLTVTSPDFHGRQSIMKCKTPSKDDDAVVNTVTSFAHVNLQSPLALPQPRVTRIKFRDDGSHDVVHMPQKMHVPQRRSHFNVTKPGAIFQLQTPNPDAFRARRRAKHRQTDPESASSGASRFKVKKSSARLGSVESQSKSKKRKSKSPHV